MGYRSKVLLAIDADELMRIKLTQPSLAEALDAADSITAGYWQNPQVSVEDTWELVPGLYVSPRIPDYYVLTWSSTKWYEGVYPEVDAITEWMDTASKQCTPEEEVYEFLRAGEEIDDIERRGGRFNLWCDIGHG